MDVRDGSSLQIHFTVKALGELFHKAAILSLCVTSSFSHFLFWDGGYSKLMDPWDVVWLMPIGNLIFTLPALALGVIGWLAFKRPGIRFGLLVLSHYVPFIPIVLIFVVMIIEKKTGRKFLA